MKRIIGAVFASLLLSGAANAQTPGPSRPKPDVKVLSQLLSSSYPPELVAAKQGGNVDVEMCIDASGAISDVRLVESSGFKALDDATLQLLPQSKWEPARDANGKPIAMCSPPYPLEIAWVPPSPLEAAAKRQGQ